MNVNRAYTVLDEAFDAAVDRGVPAHVAQQGRAALLETFEMALHVVQGHLALPAKNRRWGRIRRALTRRFRDSWGYGPSILHHIPAEGVWCSAAEMLEAAGVPRKAIP